MSVISNDYMYAFAGLNSMAPNEAVLVENAVSKLYYLQYITIGIDTFLNEHIQLVQFHLEPSNYCTTCNI